MKSTLNYQNSSARTIALSIGLLASCSVNALDNIQSDTDLSLRYRIETVDQDSLDKMAKASTVRTRLTFKTDWTHNIDTLIEFDDVTAFLLDDYNAGAGNTPDKFQYPVIADPEGTELNQAFIRYNHKKFKAAYGRQRILVGNQRFIGGVGWRQNEQTFDSLKLDGNAGLKDFNFGFAHVFNVNRIWGEEVAAGDHKHNTNLLNADYTGFANGTLSAYYFQIDNIDADTLSNNTFGVRYAGNYQNIYYAAEIATQSDGGDNPNNYSTNYLLIDANYNKDNFSVGGGLEILGGDTDGGQGFTTSLATLHKFQGWADMFTQTPAAGIKDFYLKGTYKINDYSMYLVFHDFNTDENSESLGSEIDFSVSKELAPKLSGLLKLASFNSSHSAYPSTDKFWFMLSYRFQ